MHHLDGLTRRTVLATLTSAATVDGGPTDEQRRLLDALASHVLAVAEVPAALTPAEAAGALPDADVRRLVIDGLVVLELVRHPPSDVLVDRVAAYVEALGGDDGAQQLARDHLADARDRVAEDWARVQGREAGDARAGAIDDAEADRRLRALGDCPPGSVGRSFVDFHERHGYALPTTMTSLVAHDFAHVLAGYEATPEGEVALQAMLVSATAGTAHLSGLLASLLLFEVGMLPFPDIVPKVGVLDRPGAATLVADAIVRGAAAGVDFQARDHLAAADRDLVELRAELGIPAPDPGPSTFRV